MKCPNCGREIEGSSCPFCEQPNILVNDKEYRRRREEWEREQVRLSRQETAAGREETSAADKLEELGKRLVPAKKDRKQNKKKQPDRKSKNSREPKKKLSPEELQARRSKRQRNQRLYIGMGISVLAAAFFIVIGLMSVRRMMSIYFKIDQTIYKNDWNQQAQQEPGDEQIWNGDNSGLFNAVIPKEINGKTFVSQQASMDGEYFSAVTYDALQRYYTLWCWDKNVGTVERLVTTADNVEILYVDNDGTVYYKVIEYVGEGTQAGNTLNQVKLDKTQVIIGENVLNQYIFLKNKSIVYLTDEGNLYMTTFDKVRESVLMASGVTNMMAELKFCENRYSEEALAVHNTYAQPRIVYVMDGKVRYSNLKNFKESVVLFDTQNHSVDVVYQESQKYAYCIGTNAIEGISASEEESALTLLGKIKSGTKALYLNHEESMIYISEGGKLVSIQYKDGSFSKSLIEGAPLVTGKTTSIMLPDGDGGLLTVNNGKYYFTDDLDKTIVELKGYSGNGVNLLSYHQKKIYVVDENKVMYVFDKNGKLEETVENTEYVWVG